jgi:hypothetical protein
VSDCISIGDESDSVWGGGGEQRQHRHHHRCRRRAASTHHDHRPPPPPPPPPTAAAAAAAAATAATSTTTTTHTSRTQARFQRSPQGQPHARSHAGTHTVTCVAPGTSGRPALMLICVGSAPSHRGTLSAGGGSGVLGQPADARGPPCRHPEMQWSFCCNACNASRRATASSTMMLGCGNAASHTCGGDHRQTDVGVRPDVKAATNTKRRRSHLPAGCTPRRSTKSSCGALAPDST